MNHPSPAPDPEITPDESTSIEVIVHPAEIVEKKSCGFRTKKINGPVRISILLRHRGRTYDIRHDHTDPTQFAAYPVEIKQRLKPFCITRGNDESMVQQTFDLARSVLSVDLLRLTRYRIAAPAAPTPTP